MESPTEVIALTAAYTSTANNVRAPLFEIAVGGVY